jgi:plastocyanin
MWLLIALAISVRGSPEVAIRTFQFSPDSIEVVAGTPVVWHNEDDVLHTVTAGRPDSLDAAFHGTLDGAGARFTVTFGRPGIYSYHCARHAFMRGRVYVIPSQGE